MSLSVITKIPDYIYDTVYSLVIKNNLGGLLEDNTNHFMLLQSLAVVSVVSRLIYVPPNPQGFDSLFLMQGVGNDTLFNVASFAFVYLVSQALVRHGNSDPALRKKRSVSILMAMVIVLFLKNQLRTN